MYRNWGEEEVLRSLNRLKSKTILKMIDYFYLPQGIYFVLSVFIIGLLMMFSGLLVYYSGGTQYAYLHSMYIPIILAAFAFKVSGGILAALIAGLVLGPFMPLDTANQLLQSTFSWMFRTGLFCCIGGITGFMSYGLHFRLEKLEAMLEKIAHVYAGTLKTYANAVELRDDNTAGHCQRVAYNAYQVGHALGFDRKELEALYWSGLLHDLGKIATPEHILLKTGELTEVEFEVIKKHTIIGFEMIHSISSDFDLISEGIRSHHEKWNGSGYPDGKKFDEIPIIGRVLSVVDVFEALTSQRPYRSPMSTDEALSYLKHNSGIQFDPEIVEKFQMVFFEGKIWVADTPLKDTEFKEPDRFHIDLI